MRSEREPNLRLLIAEDPPTELVAERLRDGRVALGTRVRDRAGTWQAGELHLLNPEAQAELTAWLTTPVESAWIDTIRNRRNEPLRTAGELYGEGPGAVRRLALETVGELPPELMARAMILLTNSLGPRSRQRLVDRLNRTEDRGEDAALRRRLAEENESFAYAVAAAALFDALAEAVFPEDISSEEDDSHP